MRRSTAATFFAAGALLATPAAAETLKVSHYLPAVHGIHTDFIGPWTEAVTECTNGALTFEIFPAGSQLGNVARQQEQVMAGVVDIAHGLHGIPRGRFPRTSLIDLPFLTDDAGAASNALWALYSDGTLADEYQGLKVLALHAHNGGLLHTSDKKVETMADMTGLRIRTPSPAISDMLSFLGATPQGLPPGEVYENLQRGVIDGTVFPWDPMKSFGLTEVTRNHLDFGAYTVSFFFVMNEATYSGLSPEAQACIDENSGEALVAKFGDWWDAWDAPAREEAIAAGHTITTLDDAQRAEWRAALAPMIEAYLAKAEADGIDNAREIYQAMADSIAAFEGQ